MRRRLSVFAILALVGGILSAVVVTPPSVGVAPSGVIARYAFDDAGETLAGVTQDTGANDLDGTLVGDADADSGNFAAVNGSVNSLSLDGAGDYVDLGKPALLGGTGDMTIALWADESAVPAEGFTNRLVADHDVAGSTAQMDLGLQTVGGLQYLRYHQTNADASQLDFLSTVDVDTGVNHLAVVRDDTAKTVTMYINGSADAVGSYAGTSVVSDASSGNLAIGRSGDYPGDYFAGKMDDVRFYDRPLSALEVGVLGNLFPPAITVAVTPALQYHAVGDQHTATATITPALDFMPLNVEVSGANPFQSTFFRFTDALGQVAFTYTGANAGTDTIVACHDLSILGSSTPGDCDVPFDEPSGSALARFANLSLTPTNSVNLVGVDEPVMLGLSTALGVATVPVHWQVTGANPDSGNTTLGSDGDDEGGTTCLGAGFTGADQSCFDYPNPDGDEANVGTDTVKACIDSNANLACDVGEPAVTTLVHWVAALALTPALDLNPTGTTHTVVASLGAAVSGVDVYFDVESGPNSGVSGIIPTSGAGTSSFSYVGTGGTGSDEIDAWADLNDNGIFDAGSDLAFPGAVWKDWYDDWAAINGKFEAKKKPSWTFNGTIIEATPNFPNGSGSLTVGYKALSNGRSCTFTPDGDSTGLAWTDHNGDGMRDALVLDWAMSCSNGDTAESADIVIVGQKNPSLKRGGIRIDVNAFGTTYDIPVAGGTQALGGGGTTVIDGPTPPNFP